MEVSMEILIILLALVCLWQGVCLVRIRRQVDELQYHQRLVVEMLEWDLDHRR